MSAHPNAAAAHDTPSGPTRRRRALLWGALVALLVVAQSLLVGLTVSYEGNRAQEQVEAAAAAAAADVKQALSRDLQNLQALLWNDPARPQWSAEAASLRRRRPNSLRSKEFGRDASGAGKIATRS